MNSVSEIKEYISSLISFKRLKHQVASHVVYPEVPAVWSRPEKTWPRNIQKLLHSAGIEDLYSHQAAAVDMIRSGQHVVLATPTASGKTLAYTLPLLEKVQGNPDSKALFVFPLKALAQDQLRTFEKMSGYAKGLKADAAIYDGDTSPWHRKHIREAPPNVLLTNPEMIHLSFLPHHQKWATFFSRLEMVVVDEVHTYRGIMGSHMSQVFRRLRRICSYYGTQPTFVFCSATVSNPEVLAEQLTGLKVKPITQNGAPHGRRHIVFINPVESPAQTAILLLKAALHRGLRTIVYTQSRKMTELIAIWAGSQSGPFAKRISAYRAGFLPEERREIEARMTSGDLLAVISTSALELGIDIGDLDLCLLVGYPGTVISTWQRGGRVGRSGQDAALVLIAGEDALDQYFMRNPEELLKREPEAAVVNPHNSEILAKHLTCAAAELPLKSDEPFLAEKPVRNAILKLEKEGKLLKSADGQEMYSARRAPHRHVDLRGTGNRFQIICRKTKESRGEIDGFRAFKETHPGAIYLHKGESYLVNSLNLDTMTVEVSNTKVDYYTRVRSHKNTDILEIFDKKPVWGTTVYTGRLKVTEKISGYEKWRIHTRKKINIIPLDLPPLIFETEGLWFQIPLSIQRQAEAQFLHFMGGIHAIEHAAIGIFPLLVMTDRNDLGGISTPFHQQVESAAVFIYDGVPGGAGLTRHCFKQAEALLNYTLGVISECPCESGCPSCVHSPKCGSGNRPIDKSAAGFLLEKMKADTGSEAPVGYCAGENKREIFVVPTRNNESDHKPSECDSKRFEKGQEILRRFKTGDKTAGAAQFARMKRRVRQRAVFTRKPNEIDRKCLNNVHFGVFDLETQRSAQEVGGWHRADLMGISCAVLYDSREDRYFEFLEDRLFEFIEHLGRLDLVVGFNIKRFDYQVLTGYSEFDFKTLHTLDILEDIYNHLGYRLSLAHLAAVTLGKKKTADGLQALRWWKQGRMQEIIEYCTADVAITRDLFLFGRENGYLLFQNKAEKTVRVPVNW
ncbi:DEAD/DEAH box helicase [Thermodesulfobacteriota bacterium]